MKQFITYIIIAFFSISSVAQSRTYEKTVDKLSSQFKLQTLSFSKEAFALLTYFDVSMKDELKTIVDDIDQMKIIVSSDKSLKAFINAADDIFAHAGYKSVDVSKYGNIGYSKIYVESRFTKIREAHIIIDYGQGAVVSFFGNFKYRDIKKLMKGADKVGSTSVGN